RPDARDETCAEVEQRRPTFPPGAVSIRGTGAAVVESADATGAATRAARAVIGVDARQGVVATATALREAQTAARQAEHRGGRIRGPEEDRLVRRARIALWIEDRR